MGKMCLLYSTLYVYVTQGGKCGEGKTGVKHFTREGNETLVFGFSVAVGESY